MLAVVAVIAMVVLDQIVKFLTVSNIGLHQSGGTLIPDVLGLFYTTNTGGGWSIMQGNVLFLVILPIAICAYIVYMISAKKVKHPFLKWSLILILGGALGNLIDRITNDMHVVDMFKFLFMDFPIFNVADIFITVGGTMLFIYLLFMSKDEGGRE
ncbi:MAG: signal peptidase II [Clostridia bacterium]|nr:signal peptidase II [Clostridia bacterium]